MYKNLITKNNLFLTKNKSFTSTLVSASLPHSFIGGQVRDFSITKKEKKQTPQYHRNSTLYTHTPREALANIEKNFVFPTPYEPKTIGDHFAKNTVQLLRKVSNLFFREKYIHYAIVLETIASVPGLCGGAMLHLRALRTMESNNWIKALMDESENERIHLMSFIELTKPTLIERTMVAAAQAVFWNLYLVGYAISPKIMHRVVGYLEHEAVKTYTNFLADIDAGKVENIPASKLAIEYWGLPADATLRDMILVIREDEMDHRLVNHEISNKIALDNNDPIIIENKHHHTIVVNPVGKDIIEKGNGQAAKVSEKIVPTSEI
ncbi:hypothetical protein DICPUDRAFT_44721 [Dictyostelium purpureum]|uniref:Alternative oxidase n=1 Tax=Dictyostelium purpureum TaxID=5786 RepID=F0Z7C6_DICPU|nr:uncharacterized protein DICPUDRAFT_44721 [Dictyostelium purpureum]EGC40117.1 hypothetical protein DICPUDRAFT_44721 [Dictyostelium purpureum]|eukprot:XP_003283307.1 hypothetical protein DICPUDRAFT_44721 [Dictyostelium purpureum]